MRVCMCRKSIRWDETPDHGRATDREIMNPLIVFKYRVCIIIRAQRSMRASLTDVKLFNNREEHYDCSLRGSGARRRRRRQ